MEEFNIENEKIVEVDVEKEIRQSFLDYSMSVIVSRALPDVRDGLKPVHRRILYSMGEKGLTHDKPTRKCATVVGDVLGAYHPHGDASVYGALVRLAQSFSLRYPLVEGQGNFGSVDGDPPAAYRYTEARLARIANLMLSDIDKDTVDFIPNFDDTTTEPSVLPAKIPNLLLNGSNGIAVGMATNVPPHNLCELVDAIDYLIDHPDCSPLDIMNIIKGPDFPTGGIIMGRSGIRAAYLTGRGKIQLRGRAEIQDMKANRQRIVVTEIPYMVNKAELIKSIADLVKDKRVEGISDLRDESDKKGMRIVIELKRDANAQIILNQLYKLTQLQDSVGIIMLALDNGVPKIMDLRTMLQKFIDFREDVITRRTRFDLGKAKDREHILEALRHAVDIVDEIIATIRATKGGQTEAKIAIMEKFGFDDPQASAIVAFRLGQLAGLEIKKIDDELGELRVQISEYEDILSNKEHLVRIIKEELDDSKKKYGDARKTDIENVTGEVDIEDLIPEETCIIARTHGGYFKRQSLSEYRTQHRGGRGVSGITRKEDDFVEDIYSCNSHDHLMFMTSLGRVYDIKSFTIAEGSKQSKGTHVNNLMPLLPNEKISSVLKIADVDDSKFICMITKKGIIKRSELLLYKKLRKTGAIGIELDEGDELAYARITSGNDDLVVATKNGMCIRFNEQEARAMSRATRGVRAILLNEGDEVAGMANVSDGGKIMTVTSEGRARLTPMDAYKVQRRGGVGVRNFECTDGITVVGIRSVNEDKDDAVIMTTNGTVIRLDVRDIATQSRYGSGVKAMKVDEGDEIVTFTTMQREEETISEAEKEAAVKAEQSGEYDPDTAVPTEEELEKLIAKDVGVMGEDEEDQHYSDDNE